MSPRRALLLGPPLLLLAVLFAWPLGSIVGRGIGEAGIAPLGRVLTDPTTWRVVGFTLGQAVASTVATLVVGLPGALLLARYRFRGRRLLAAAVMVPFVLPTIVVGAAFVALGSWLAPAVELRGTVTAIVLAHVFFNHAVVVRTVGGLWANLDPAEEEAARTLGAGPWRAFATVTLPRLMPSIGAAGLIVLLFTSTSFGIVLLLGGPTRATVEVEIHRAMTQALDLPTAAALALLQLVAVVATLTAYGRLVRRSAPTTLASAEHLRRDLHGPGARVLVAVNLVVGAAIVAPLAALVGRSLTTSDGFGLDHYRALAGPAATTALAVAPGTAIANSLLLASVATVIAVATGLAAAVAATGRSRAARLVDGAMMLPLGVSSVTIGLGFLVGFGRFVTPATAIVLVPLAQALVAVPFVVRTTLPTLRSIDRSLREAASTLGAAPARVWREVDLPIVSRAVAVAAGFAFAVALGEFGATVFLARATAPTVPTAIFRLLGRPGVANVGQASALAVVLAVMAGGAVMAIDRARLGRVGTF